MNQTFDCVIIGAGISGMTAAIYLQRANKNIILIEKNIPGGLINKTSAVANYPGFTKIDGPSLVMNIYDQIKNLKVPFLFNEVVKIEDGMEKQIYLKNKEILKTKSIIISTGRIPRTLGILNEKKLTGHGISYCALCDGAFFKDKEVCVVGGGNSALEESCYLADICSKVTILNRSNYLKADNTLIQKIKNKRNVQILYNSSIEKVNGEEKLESVVVNGKIISCEGLFIYIGLDPDIKFLENLNINNENGYIIVDNNMRTNLNRIYACGDVIKKDVYQIITASAEGAIAASTIIKEL